MLMLLVGNSQDTVVPPVEGVAGGGTAYGWGDDGLHTSSSFKRSIDPTEVLSADLVHVWCMPSTANVGPQESPKDLEPVSIIILFILAVHFATMFSFPNFQFHVHACKSFTYSLLAWIHQCFCFSA